MLFHDKGLNINIYFYLNFTCIEKRRFIIENRAFTRHIDTSITQVNLVMASVACIFLPYVLSGVLLVTIALYIIINKRTRSLVLLNRNSKVFFGFFGFYMLISTIYGNWMGLLAGIGFSLAVVLVIYESLVMTKALYEKALNLICIFSTIGTAFAISEKILMAYFDNIINYERVCSLFLHPNYFGTISATVIIICAYKILAKQEPSYIYFLVGIMNAVNVYLSESMFAWIEVFAGVAVLLFVLEYYNVLIWWISTILCFGFMILVMDIDLLPRLSEADITLNMRFPIWERALSMIKSAPLLGRGPMAYAYSTFKGGELVPHSHSIYLELFIDFGVLGGVVLIFGSLKYLFHVLKTCFMDKKKEVTALILAVTAAALVHGIVDLTLMWIQTLPLFLFLLSGIGALKKDAKEVMVK